MCFTYFPLIISYHLKLFPHLENKLFFLLETALVRLKGSNVTHMGRVEIKRHGFWHAVCSIGFDIHDADVVCRQLGFSEAVLEVAHGQFGLGSGPMWLTSIRCQGNESSLDECVSAGWELEPSCRDKHSSGVVCRTPNITSGKKRSLAIDLRRLDWIFQGQNLPTLSINYVAIYKD